MAGCGVWGGLMPALPAMVACAGFYGGVWADACFACYGGVCGLLWWRVRCGLWWRVGCLEDCSHLDFKVRAGGFGLIFSYMHFSR